MTPQNENDTTKWKRPVEAAILLPTCSACLALAFVESSLGASLLSLSSSQASSLICCPLFPRLSLHYFSNLFIDLGNQITFVQTKKQPGVMEDAFIWNQESVFRCRFRMEGWEGPPISSLSSLSLPRWRNRRPREAAVSLSLGICVSLGCHFAYLSFSFLICLATETICFNFKGHLKDGNCADWPEQ